MTNSRQANERALQQIEKVLDQLNGNTDDITAKSCGHGLNIKENINMLKSFPRPNSSVRGLVSMVNDIVNELDN